jgi:hypothetical protein
MLGPSAPPGENTSRFGLETKLKVRAPVVSHKKVQKDFHIFGL